MELIGMEDLERHRGELTSYCGRMLGSSLEAEDAVQETFVRAWRSLDRFEGRASLRSWLYRIATNVCHDMRRGPQRRARPLGMGSEPLVEGAFAAAAPGDTWARPLADARTVAADGDPAEMAAEREAIRLAFVTALQHLPPRQRAVLILREVLRWKADEVAELLGSTVASVNSALQRARSTIATRSADPSRPLDETQRTLLARYLEAFGRFDIDTLVSLLQTEALAS